MIPPPDLIDAHAIVFGDRAGARYRSGRTMRLLKRRFQHVTDAMDSSAGTISQIIRSHNIPVWLMRAGTLPRDLSNWFLPHANGKPLCAFGMTWNYPAPETPRSNAILNESLQSEFAALAAESAAWSALQSKTGGDLSMRPDLPRQLPAIASALIDPRLLPPLAEKIAECGSLDAALRATLAAQPVRCVRLPHLDVFDDPAIRVAQVVTSLQRGGAERITLDLTRELPHWRVRPRLFVLGSAMRAAFQMPEEFCAFKPGRNRAGHVSNFAEHALSMGFDLVHAHLLSAGDMAIIGDAGLPVVTTVHNARQGWPSDFHEGKLRNISLLAACAQAVERDLNAARTNLPVRTVWNGIDWADYRLTAARAAKALELRKSLELAPDDFVLLSLANPRPQKRLERLPAVLAEVRALLKQRGSNRDAKLIVAGEASRSSEESKRCENELRNEITRLSLGDHVKLIGAAEDVAPLLQACDALVSVSAWEGLSLAHLEALTARKFVVATAAGGTAEIARDHPNLKVVPLDATPRTIAESIFAVFDQATDPVDALEIDSRKRATFMLHTMASRYASLYPRAIESSRPKCSGSGICLIANNFTTGGAQSSARRLLLAMHARGIRVRAAVIQEREDNLTPGVQSLRAAGVPVSVIESPSADPLDAVQQMLELIDADRPESILFWNVIAEHKVLLADAIWDIPIYDVSPGEMFFDSLDQYFARPRPGLPYRSGAEYGARLAGVVVKYQREAERATLCLNAPTHVIPNGLPLDGGPLRQSASADSRLVIGTSARISPQKKLEQLIAALRIAAPKIPSHVLRIAGRTETGAEEYAQSLRDLGEGLSIEWIEEFQDSKTFLAGLDIFAMISEPAGCPNASLEAMAAGLPLVVTDHGGACEQVIDGVNGRIVPRGDVEAFAAALIELAHDKEKRRAFGTAARKIAADKFSIERMTDDYVRLCLGS